MWTLLLAVAAAADRPANVVLADLGLHVLGVGYQRTLAPVVALQVDADLWVPWTTVLLGTDPGDVRGTIVRVRPVFFPGGTAPDGWWASPFVQGGPASGTRDGAKDTGWTVAAGVSGGFAGQLGPVHLSVGLGGQYHVARIGDDDRPPSFAELFPTIDGTVGYAF